MITLRFFWTFIFGAMIAVSATTRCAADDLPSHITKTVDTFDGKETYTHARLQQPQYWSQHTGEAKIRLIASPILVREHGSPAIAGIGFHLKLPESLGDCSALTKLQVKEGETLRTYEFSSLFMSGTLKGGDGKYEIILKVLEGNELQVILVGVDASSVMNAIRKSTDAAPVAIRFAFDKGTLTLNVPESFAAAVAEFADWAKSKE